MFGLSVETCLLNLKHRPRLHGGDRGDRPHILKVVGVMPPSRPHRNCVMSFFETVKLVNFFMYRRLSGSTLLQSRLISWLTFCVLYTVAFSNFSWSILLCLFFTYFPNSIFRLFSSRAFSEVSVSSLLHRDVKASKPKWHRGQNFGLGLEAVASVLALALSIWPRPGLSLFVPLPSSHLFS